MKNYKWIVAVVVFIAFAKANSLQAQKDFKAIASYIVQSKFDVKEDTATSKEEVKDPRQAEMRAMLRKALAEGSKQEFELKFTPSESTYEKVVELAKPKPASGMSVSFMVNNGSTNTIYKDITAGKYYKEDQIMGKEFLVNGEMVTYNWQLVNETKQIGQYTCYKAIYVPEKTEEQLKKEEENKEKANNGSLLALIPDEDPTITAWYTPEIAISNGPGEYHGLPGLILEVKEKNTVLLCTKIEINPEKGFDIKKPRSGKKISQEKFDELQKKKMQERMDKNGGSTFIIESFGGD